VSCFCAKIQLSGKIPEKLQKSYFTRRPTEPEYETERGWEAATPPGGAAQAWLRQGVVRPPQSSPQALLLPTYTSRPETIGVRRFSQIEFRYATTTTRNHDSEPESPFWHPTGTGIWRRSSSSSPTSLHQPSMTPPSMCE
jgi:hypothetical protein